MFHAARRGRGLAGGGVGGEIAVGGDGEILFKAIGDFESVDVADGGAEVGHELFVVVGFFHGVLFLGGGAEGFDFGVCEPGGSAGAFDGGVVFFEFGDGAGEGV
ncbi:MAG: hypothetical protein AABZ08_01190, partial [Planctomycetota bacterium]